ncbi:MAG: hypothetical protein APU95_00205 [Hadesarchaea archaeon YNP_N21]|nr:MAG: hypothetical protein APU95_00205 [Hadesarchaea archaeon YNP_N21]
MGNLEQRPSKSWLSEAADRRKARTRTADEAGEGQRLSAEKVKRAGIHIFHLRKKVGLTHGT